MKTLLDQNTEEGLCGVKGKCEQEAGQEEEEEEDGQSSGRLAGLFPAEERRSQTKELVVQSRIHGSPVFLQIVSGQKHLIQSGAEVKAPVSLVTLMPVRGPLKAFDWKITLKLTLEYIKAFK